MFSNFSNTLLETMHNQSLAFHYHTYGISAGDYQSIPSLRRFFKVISTDTTYDKEEFLTALEAYNYPIYALMYHPEYQWLDFLSTDTFNTIKNN